ncbi:hypothetical protein KIN20_022267 [Parelaphostrongylus tenuis]|uniref:Uncharacterized protein n=1 Tax=Parelaphostrongylus tenuis TaxID=148309 RepID=A0AAD5MVA8_PARTN|nr:hypothetical protein KIN20_022267 [Parelaphostrongylus tenuis]
MVLVSAVDCTFYWNFEGKRKSVVKCPFYDSSNKDPATMRYFLIILPFNVWLMLCNFIRTAVGVSLTFRYAYDEFED